MKKLFIDGVARVNEHRWAIRFSGQAQDHKTMRQALKMLGREHAYWDPKAFEGDGGWVVSPEAMQLYQARFSNYDSFTLGLDLEVGKRIKCFIARTEKTRRLRA